MIFPTWDFSTPFFHQIGRSKGARAGDDDHAPGTPSPAAEFISRQRIPDTPFDIIKYRVNDGKDSARGRAIVKEYEIVGVTWWIEEIFTSCGTRKQIQKRIAAGPPA
jgi:hypothetical protein